MYWHHFSCRFALWRWSSLFCEKLSIPIFLFQFFLLVFWSANFFQILMGFQTRWSILNIDRKRTNGHVAPGIFQWFQKTGNWSFVCISLVFFYTFLSFPSQCRSRLANVRLFSHFLANTFFWFPFWNVDTFLINRILWCGLQLVEGTFFTRFYLHLFFEWQKIPKFSVRDSVTYNVLTLYITDNTQQFLCLTKASCVTDAVSACSKAKLCYWQTQNLLCHKLCEWLTKPKFYVFDKWFEWHCWTIEVTDNKLCILSDILSNRLIELGKYLWELKTRKLMNKLW